MRKPYPKQKLSNKAREEARKAFRRTLESYLIPDEYDPVSGSDYLDLMEALETDEPTEDETLSAFRF